MAHWNVMCMSQNSEFFINTVTINNTLANHSIDAKYNKLASLKKKEARRGQHHYFQIVYRL